LVAVLFALAGAGSLTACTVPPDGRVGIAVSEAGQPEAVLVSCKHQMNGASLYWYDDPNPTSPVLAKWTLPSGYTSPLQWSLVSPKPDEVTVVSGPAALMPGTVYSIYGWTGDHSYSAPGVQFTLEDIADLRPGEVLTWDPSPPPHPQPRASGETGPFARVSMDEFKKAACPDQ
jgi:hypothetical protein